MADLGLFGGTSSAEGEACRLGNDLAPVLRAGVCFANKKLVRRGKTMTNLKAIATTALVASAALSWTVPAKAGQDVGAGLLGFGVGALVGSALTPHEVYVAPPSPPPPPAYYGPAAYGPPAWSPAWYQYCRSIHGPNFDPRSGYFQAADGGWYFCR